MLRESLRYAIVGSFDRANVVAPILGAAAIFVGMRLAGFKIASPTDIGGSIYLLLASLGLPWIVIVTGRFIYWPWRELQNLRRSSPLEVFVDPKNGSFREWGENPNKDAYEGEKHGQFYSVEVVNHGTQTLNGVRVVYSYAGKTNHHAAFGTAKLRALSLDPNSRRMVKLFFQPQNEYIWRRGISRSVAPRYNCPRNCCGHCILTTIALAFRAHWCG